MGKTTLLKRFVVEILDYANEDTEAGQSVAGGFVPLLMPVVTLAGILGSAASTANDTGEAGSQAIARRTSAQAAGGDVPLDDLENAVLERSDLENVIHELAEDGDDGQKRYYMNAMHTCGAVWSQSWITRTARSLSALWTNEGVALLYNCGCDTE